MSLSAKLLASGTGWRVSDFVCTSGPRDPCYVEQHGAYSIALVTDGLAVLAAAQALREESSGREEFQELALRLAGVV